VRKFGILAIVVLLAVSGLAAALAYTSAEVDNPMSMDVVSTDDALLAMSPGDYEEAVNIEGGKLVLTPGKGFGGEMFGFQPGSKYTFEKIFTVENNAEFDIDCWYELTGNLEKLKDDGFFKVYMDNPNQPDVGYEEWEVRHITTIDHSAGNDRDVKFVFDFTGMSSSTYDKVSDWDLGDEMFKVHAEPRE